MVMSPEPVISTEELPLISFLNCTFVSVGVRPRQSNTTVRGILIVTPRSVEKFCQVAVPEPLKSMLTV